MQIIKSSNARAVSALIDARPASNPALQRRVAAIVDRVRREGDAAVLRYARRFDGLQEPIEVTRREIDKGAAMVSASVKRAIALAAKNIRAVAGRQRPRPWTIAPVPGITIRQRVLPLDRVGCYVPGGRYPLPSSLLMTAIPARVAGVPEVIVMCPRPDPTVMYAALEAGVSRLFRLGGAQAIAAMAYGTRRIPRVDRIVGPGNAYVAAAKALVSRDCAIDFFAGPSEIAILSTSGKPAWVAADLIAQAEHDPDARAIFVTPSMRLALAVAAEVKRQLPSEGPARQALASHGGIVVTRSLDEAVALFERLAPEHAVCDSPQIAARLTRAGTIFVGSFSAQAAGDYVTGSNHVLPTGGAAAARGGLSTADFTRAATVQRITPAGLRRVGPAGIALAVAEGLEAHADSLRIRLSPAPRSRRQ
jgi:histidinol dehydrogenase